MKPSVRLVYNASDSARRGFYAVLPVTRLRVGDYVVARVPEDTEKLAARRGYLPMSGPVLKRIAALGGQQICVRGGFVTVDGVAVASVLQVDARHRRLVPGSTVGGC